MATTQITITIEVEHNEDITAEKVTEVVRDVAQDGSLTTGLWKALRRHGNRTVTSVRLTEE